MRGGGVGISNNDGGDEKLSRRERQTCTVRNLFNTY